MEHRELVDRALKPPFVASLPSCGEACSLFVSWMHLSLTRCEKFPPLTPMIARLLAFSRQRSKTPLRCAYFTVNVHLPRVPTTQIHDRTPVAPDSGAAAQARVGGRAHCPSARSEQQRASAEYHRSPRCERRHSRVRKLLPTPSRTTLYGARRHASMQAAWRKVRRAAQRSLYERPVRGRALDFITTHRSDT